MVPTSRLLLAAVISSVLAGACGETATRTYPLERAPSMLSADGTVVATAAANGNTKLTITVKHVAPPDRVVPGATVYVVWARPTTLDAEAQNIGVLALDDALAGKLETLTAFATFDLTITAEKDRVVTTPTNATVLSARVAAAD